MPFSVCVPAWFKKKKKSCWPLSKRYRTCPRPHFAFAVRREREGKKRARSNSFPPPLLSTRHSWISFNSTVSSVAGGSKKEEESSLMLSPTRCCHNGGVHFSWSANKSTLPRFRTLTFYFGLLNNNNNKTFISPKVRKFALLQQREDEKKYTVQQIYKKKICSHLHILNTDSLHIVYSVQCLKGQVFLLSAVLLPDGCKQ